MKYISLLTVTILLSLTNITAQINMVKNGSFEDIWRCPINYDQIKFANFWSPIDTITQPALGDTFGTFYCTPELCHTCGPHVEVGMPLNARFYHYPRTGNGVAQMVIYTNDTITPYQRDYLQGTLRSKLINGKQYCLTFYVIQEQGSAFHVNKIGAYFDDRTIDTTANCGLPQTTHTPQVFETAIISDTTNWTRIQGVFTATGIETHITIGNFFSIDSTDTVRTHFIRAIELMNDRIAAYLIDDVSVIPIDAVADAGLDQVTSLTGDSVWVGNHDGHVPCKWYKNGVLIDSNIGGFKVKPATDAYYVMELDVCGVVTRDTAKVHVAATTSPLLTTNNQLLLSPNPVKESLTITGAAGCEVAVYDVLGRCVYTGTITTAEAVIDVAALLKGVYLVKITNTTTMEGVTLRLLKE